MIDELISAHKSGTLREVFGTGTAATIVMIQQLTYRDYTIQLDTTQWEVAPLLKKNINNVRDKVVPDTRGWLFPVNY
jgi:branched-chain amino acid aminotransferase